MLNFLKKDLKIITRDLGELALLLLMPLVLIAILGFALGGLLGGDAASSEPPIHIDALLVVEDDIADGRSAFVATLADSDTPLVQRAGLLAAVQTFDPIDIVRSFLNDEGLGELMTVTEAAAAEAAAALTAGDAHAVITLPSGFSHAMYRRMLLAEGDSAEIRLQLGDDAPLSTSIVRDMLQTFASEFNLQTALQQIQAEQGSFLPESLQGASAAAELTGGIEIVGGETRNVPSFAYYAFAMAVMFMLYLIGGTATRAYLELTSNNFDRIMISNASPTAFVTSKAVAAALVGFVQMMILITVTHLLFGAFDGQPASFWGQAALIAAAMALAVGAIAALVTSLVFRSDSRVLADTFNSVIVFVFATVGGSFVPVGEPGSLIVRIGNWTPNGAALSSLLDAASGLGFDSWGTGLIRLLLMAAVGIILAIVLFPRTRSA